MLIPLALAALLTLAPVKAEDDATPACPDGQVESPEGCSDQAWVDPEDCPPERLCAAGAPDEPQSYGGEDCIECSGPVDGPVQYGNESCIDCTSAPPQTCMDGAQEGEVCDEDVQYFGPGPADTGDLDDVPAPASDDHELSSDDASSGKDAPALTAVLLVAALGAIVLVLRRK